MLKYSNTPALDASMVYTKRRTGYGRRRRGYGRRGSNATASKALRVATRVASVLRGTKTLHELTQATPIDFYVGSFANANHFQILNLIEDGVGEGQRIGDEVVGAGLHFRASFTWGMAPTTTADASASRAVRVVIYNIKAQINGSHTPDWTDVFDPTGINSTKAQLATYDKQKMGNIKVLYDKIIMITVEKPFVDIDVVLKTPYLCKYDAYTGLTDAQYTNSIRLMMIPCGPTVPNSATIPYMSTIFKSCWSFYQ